MKKFRRAIALLLAALLLAAALPGVLAASPDYVTRGEVADMLLSAADDYNPGLRRSDLIRGGPDGDPDEDGLVTRAQALVMLSRAFGDLPAPVGDNARSGYNVGNFTDVPTWAQEDLQNVFQSGIVAGTSPTTLSPDANVTREQMNLLIRRVYALEGSNLKDDFYATVNKQALDSSTIQPGCSGTGSFTDLSMQVNKDVAQIIRTIANGTPKTGGEQKIAALYGNILDVETRNQAGIAPIRPYLDAIDSAGSLEELMRVNRKIYADLGTELLLSFGLRVDAKDSNAYDLTFQSLAPSLGQNGYSGASAAQKDAYLTYLATLLKLIGKSGAEASQAARNIWDAEAAIAGKSLPAQDRGDVDQTYNLYTMAQLQALFPHVELAPFFAQTGLAQTDKFVVADVGALKAAAALFDDAHLEVLKNFCLLSLAGDFGICLNQDFTDAQTKFQESYLGMSGSRSVEDTATQYVQSLMSDYLGQAYVSRHFSAKAKADVEQMAQDIIRVYKKRIRNLTWMSDETKAKATRKLDAMKLKIGYPDKWNHDLDGVEILPASEGGSFFANLVALRKAYRALYPKWQDEGPDKEEFGMAPYTVNAQYDPTENSIEFPAGILQAPFYDVNASYEKNLGGIGYVIAHEITHAFDNNGAKYDEHGNAADWWTEEDYAAFQELCGRVVRLYNGRESAPGIACNGFLTLSENIADLGAAACITELEGERAKPDYPALYTAAGQIWYSSYPRELKQYLSRADVHAPDKLRGSLVLQNFAQFYDAFGIAPGDGMWLDPAERVVIW